MKDTIFLLAEDDPQDRTLVEQHFTGKPAHLKLRHVRDGAEAIDYLEARGKYADRQKYPIPDVILLNLNMPRVNGFEFLKWLRREAPSHMRIIPAVVMSSSSEESDVTRSYELGANSYLVKPIKWAEFQDRIKEIGVYWGEHSETPKVPPESKTNP